MLNKCIHSRNLSPFYNSNENIAKFNFIANHLKSCNDCLEDYSVIKSNGAKLRTLIPKVEITEDLQKSFEAELKNLIERTITPKSETKLFKVIPSSVVNTFQALYSALTSRTLVRAYFFLGIYIVVVKSLSA